MTNSRPRLFLVAASMVFALVARAGVVLNIDVNDATSPDDTAPGFTPYFLSDETLNVGPYSIDMNPAGGSLLDDGSRLTPTTSGTLTLAALYRDTAFASPSNATSYYRVGLDAVVSGLTPGKPYALTAWSFDSSASGSRMSNWSVLGLGGPQFAVNEYNFNGSTLPANDTANRFSVTARADASGRLTLRGRQDAAATVPQVFLNGFTVDELAGPALDAETVLALDFNSRSATDTHAGFQSFTLQGSGAQTVPTTRTYGVYSATVTHIGTGSLEDRALRALSNAGAFTEASLHRDFIFNSTGGIDLKIAGLPANRDCLVELWSYEPLSTGARVSDWTANGGILWDDYTFNGSILPTTNDDSKMVGTFTTNASGELLISGRVVSGAPSVFLSAVRVSLLVTPQIVDLGHPIISEFLAHNEDGLADEDGDPSDWIEIWNTTGATLDLSGWRLTDDPARPGRWIFPNGVTVPSQGRLLVWATGKNRAVNFASLHTTFGLAREAGAYLALLRPDASVAHAYTGLPAQYEDASYGVAGTAEPLTQGYFVPPTPRGPNGAPIPGFVADTTFDFTRGFYSAPFNVHVDCATPGAQIYYTKDGSEPTTSSTLYPGAAGIPITTTTVLRVKAFAPPLQPTNTDTQTYIFNAHVQNQPANPAGWPATWGVNGEVDTQDGAGNGTVPANYEMDPAVVGSTLAGYSVTNALSALPALSVVLPPAGFHSVGSGIYANPQSTGDLWERAASLELLELDGSGFNTGAGIRVHGNSSRRPYRMQKHSFRLAFRAAYGDGRLNYRLFDSTNVQRFNRLVLHAFFTDGWGLVSWDANRYRPDTALSFRDAFMKQSFADMGHAVVSGRFAHLYVNGLYWGIYRIGERVDDDWCADHFGGLTTDWDVIAFGESDYARSGTATAWDALFTFVNGADLTVQANYENVAAQLDLANFIDYYLLHVHGDSEDWPHHNGYAIRNRVAPGSKWKFITWDQELAFDPLVQVNRLTNTTAKTPGQLLQRMRTSPEFRLLFADRAHKHLNNTGALSIAKSQARWQSFATALDQAIVAESARWGDTADETPYGTSVPAGTVMKRETHWLPQVNLVKNSHIPSLHNRSNGNATIPELTAGTLWPSVEPPGFSTFGGNVPANHVLTITGPTGGTIYYTVTGADPRKAFTGAVDGTPYTGPVTLTATCTLKARARSSGGVWSALTEARFIVGIAASSANLAITELFYDPFNSDHEFIELTNFSADTIDLTGVHFAGVTFQFEDGTLLAPGERIVVARNSAVFIARYGSGPRLAGQYSGALDNNGEELAVIAANGADITRFRFDNNNPWPRLPAGGTHSIVLRATAGGSSDPANWRVSAIGGGSPGGSDSVAFTGDPLADVDQDGLLQLMEYALGTSDAVATPTAGAVATVENFDVEGVPTPFLTLTVRVATTADDAILRAELSVDLSEWDGSERSVAYLGEIYIDGGRVIRKWRALEPIPASGAPQYFRLRAELP